MINKTSINLETATRRENPLARTYNLTKKTARNIAKVAFVGSMMFYESIQERNEEWRLNNR